MTEVPSAAQFTSHRGDDYHALKKYTVEVGV